jgi:hypothetical protein
MGNALIINGNSLQSSALNVDSNGNMSALNTFLGFATTATAAGITTLTVASQRTQEFTGTTTQTVRLPTTGVPQGAAWRVINNSTGNVTVQSSGANSVLVMGPGTTAEFTAKQATPTTAAHWSYAAPLRLTTTGTSGAATLSGNTLNIPLYTGGGGGSGSMPSVVDSPFNADPTGATSSGNAFRAAAAAGPIRVPAGNYIFDGAPISTDNLIVHGDGPGQTQISISAGNRFWDKTDFFDCMEVSGIRFAGGAGAIRSTYANTTVSGFRIIENCRFEDFTQCAVGHRNTDSPYWSVRDCAFAASFATDAASAGTICLALSGLVDTVNIDNCDFYCYQIGVKLGLVGSNAHIRGGNFLRYAAYTTFPRTDVWLPPWPTNPFVSGDNGGDGFVIRDVKFGNEGKDNNDFCVLYADEAAAGTGFEAKLPSYTASTGYVVGHTIRDVVHSCNATGEVPLVHSTTPNIFGCQIGPVFQSGASDIALLRILNATGIDPAYFNGNTVGPMLNGINDQFVQSSANLVTAVTGTIPYQPQNASGTKVNSLRASGARTLIPAIKLNTATGTTNTFTLPSDLTLAQYKGVEFIFKNEGSGNLTIAGATNSIWAAAQVTSYTIAAGAGGRLINDGSHWVTF